jgi:flagellar hook protein FlgE
MSTNFLRLLITQVIAVFKVREKIMGFQQGLSGLNAASKSLDVIGNNISNANTVGFKQAQVQFADVYANSLSGASANAVGIGVRVSTIAQQFTQGNISSTNNPLDTAINGNGFFRMIKNGAVTYTQWSVSTG